MFFACCVHIMCVCAYISQSICAVLHIFSIMCFKSVSSLRTKRKMAMLTAAQCQAFFVDKGVFYFNTSSSFVIPADSTPRKIRVTYVTVFTKVVLEYITRIISTHFAPEAEIAIVHENPTGTAPKFLEAQIWITVDALPGNEGCSFRSAASGKQ